MSAEPLPAEYAFLMILKAEGRQLSNTEMERLYKVRLISPAYEKLNSEGWVTSDTKHKPYRHEITAKGLRTLSAELPADADRVEGREKRSPREKQLWAGMVAQQKLILGAHGGPKNDGPADLESRIRETYAMLAGTHGAWVDLAALRPFFRDVTKDELDKALVHMLDAREVNLEPDPLRSRIGAAQRAAAVRVDGEDRHKLAIGRP
jgi:hypothetical protein